ncbi:hypothetical protein P8452_02271 [Trifolium repens]|nr:hypothetical protein P8452_02271 [Trifolium repens]
MLQHLRSIIYLLEHKLYSTRRDFYYTDTELFNNKQVCSEQAFEAVALLLLCHRDSLPVYNAMSRGSVVGHLTFNYKVLQTAGDRVFDDGEPRGFSYHIRENVLNIDARDSDIFGRDIPILVDKITCLNSKEALFILVVESKAILVSLYSAGF